MRKGIIPFLKYKFLGSVKTLVCMDAADVDDDGELTITDAIRSLNYLFVGTADAPEPPGPFNCGYDVNDDNFPICKPNGVVKISALKK